MPKFLYSFINVTKKDLVSQFFFKDELKLPAIEKIIVQVSFKESFFRSNRVLGFSLFVLEFLTHQKPVFSFSKKDVAFWRLRKSGLVSLYVTLRKKKMWFFIEKLLFTLLSKTKPRQIVTHSTKRPVVTINVSNFMIFSELEREVNKFHKKNNNKQAFNVTATFIFSKSVEPLFKPKFLLQQMQYPISK